MPNGDNRVLPMKLNIEAHPEDMDHALAMLASGGPVAMPAVAPPAPVTALGMVPQAQAQEAAGYGPFELPSTVPGRPGRSTLGKVGHALGVVGQVAGSALVPHVMPWVPGTEQYRERQQQYENLVKGQTAQREALEAETGLRGAQAGLAGAETEKTQKLIPSEVELAGAQAKEVGAHGELLGQQAEIYKAARDAMGNKDVKAAFDVLSDPDSSVADRRNAFATISQSPISMLPMLREQMIGAENLYRQGEVGARVRGHNVIPDANSPTGYSTVQYDALGNPMGVIPVQPSAATQIIMGPQAGQYISRQGQLAGTREAATQAQKLLQVVDPDTKRVMGTVPQGQLAQLTGAGSEGIAGMVRGGMEPKPTTTVIGQAQMANTLEEMTKSNIYPQIEKSKNLEGIWTGRVQNFLLKNVGDPNSEAAKLQAQLDAIPMMLGRMYGYRSAEYAREYGNFLNLRMTPEALKGYLDGVITHARSIAAEGGMAPRREAGAPPAGAKIRDFTDFFKKK